MIYDKLENLSDYLPNRDFQQIYTMFLQYVSPNMEERVYSIDDDRIYARVMSYETKESDICKIEAHDKYIDIQCTINGAEGIDVYDRRYLSISEPYDSDKDVVFFNRNDASIIAHTNNVEGYFTILTPNEAHAPQERVGQIRKVKKFVIKYRTR